MKHVKKHAWLVTTVLLVLCSTQALAIGTPVLSASGSLGEITYKLIDLDPNDGIAANVTFDQYAFLTLRAQDKINIKTNDSFGEPYTDALSGSVALSNGTAVLSSNQGQLSGSTGYDANDLSNFVSQIPAGSNYKDHVSGSADYYFNFTLTPKTRIEFSANVDLDALVDITALKSYGTTLMAQTSAGVSASINRGVRSDVGFVESTISRTVKVYKDGSVLNDLWSDPSNNTDLFLTWTNGSNVDAGTTLFAYMFVNSQIDASPVSIPEAGTQWMFGLGLISLAGVVARRRK